MKQPLYLILILLTVSTVCSYAQTVTGSVNSNSQPLSGASIKIEGKKLETSTNQDGHFEISLQPEL